MEWKKRTKRKTSSTARFRYWTTTDNRYQIVFTESTLMPKPWKRLPKDQRSKYLRPVYQALMNDGGHFTWLIKKYFKTFKAAERAIVQAVKKGDTSCG